MSGIQKNILIFFALLGAGAAMLWLVWRVQGTFGFVFGILGALLIIISLKWMEIVLREQEVEKRALQQEFETLYGVGKREVSGPAFKPIENPVLRKKLAWIFGSLALVCGALVLLGQRFPEVVLIVAFPIWLWSMIMFAASQEKFKAENPAHDFSYMWSVNPVFRRINLSMGLLMGLVVWLGWRFTPPPPNSAPYVIALIVAAVLVLFLNIFYIRFTLQKHVPGLFDGWSVGEKRLERTVDILIILVMMAGYPILSIFLPNLIYELYFALTFAALGLLVGYLVHDFLRNRFTGFFDNSERKQRILLEIYLGSLVLTLSAATIINKKTSYYHMEQRFYKVTDKSTTYKGKHYLWLEIDGAVKRFEPRNSAEWDRLEPGDTADVWVGRGILGFEDVLIFSSKR